jgi:hypothetical protein
LYYQLYQDGRKHLVSNSVTVNKPVSIESLTLANHVESVNGLLYISGGGWTSHNRVVTKGGQPPLSHLGLAIVIAIPWNETNRVHSITIEIRDEDANAVLVGVNAQINVGRPPTLKPGTSQYPTIGLPIDLIFPHAGGYEVIARVDGTEGDERRWAFQVQDIQQLAATT